VDDHSSATGVTTCL